MTQIPANLGVSKSKANGCLFLIALVIFLTVCGVLAFNTYTSPYHQAKRKLSAGDVDAAAGLLADAIREDNKSHSFRSVRLLSSIRDPRALPAMIDLMDIPDGEWVRAGSAAIVGRCFRDHGR